MTVFALSLAGVCACNVGTGTGVVQGTLNVPQCTFDPIRILPEQDTYDLRADFFVGQPIDADPVNAARFPANQMIIRVQRTGQRLELADALVFWVFDSAKVARCLRGGVNAAGEPEWDPALCDRPLGSMGEGRVRIGMTTEIVRSFFVLNASCSNAYISADALGNCTDASESCPEVTLCPGHGSWISFSRYGSLPGNPNEPIGPGFKVNDGEHITASAFHVELCDVATVLAALDKVVPVPAPNITGTLDGNFDFDLERGQAGQPFP
jgi:hypothetical protein